MRDGNDVMQQLKESLDRIEQSLKDPNLSGKTYGQICNELNACLANCKQMVVASVTPCENESLISRLSDATIDKQIRRIQDTIINAVNREPRSCFQSKPLAAGITILTALQILFIGFLIYQVIKTKEKAFGAMAIVFAIPALMSAIMAAHTFYVIRDKNEKRKEIGEQLFPTSYTKGFFAQTQNYVSINRDPEKAVNEQALGVPRFS